MSLPSCPTNGPDGLVPRPTSTLYSVPAAGRVVAYKVRSAFGDEGGGHGKDVPR